MSTSTPHFTSGAVGTRDYAAPEVLSGIRKVDDALNSSLGRSTLLYNDHKLPKKSLGTCISSYGMVADSFSVGTTIHYMLTGVPAGTNVEDFMAVKNHPLVILARSLMKCFPKSNRKRAKTHRTSSDLPGNVRNLIRSLTHHDPGRRATVRSATRHPWIETSASTPPEVEHGGPIEYLKCGGD